MNTPLLRKVQAAILEEPKRLDMGDWVFLDSKSAMAPACGTVGCIAGWSVLLNHEPDPTKALDAVYDLGFNDYTFFAEDLLGEAILILGLEEDPLQYDLFYDLSWPEHFQARLRNTRPRTPQYAQVVSDYIDYFIALHEAVPA